MHSTTFHSVASSLSIDINSDRTTLDALVRLATYGVQVNGVTHCLRNPRSPLAQIDPYTMQLCHDSVWDEFIVHTTLREHMADVGAVLTTSSSLGGTNVGNWSLSTFTALDASEHSPGTIQHVTSLIDKRRPRAGAVGPS